MSQTDKGIRAIDLFCGVGGSSWGARSAGCDIVAGFDLWEVAGQAYKSNFPEAEFVLGRLESLDMATIKPRLGDVDLIIASPECTNHSPAKGSGPRCEASKATAFQVVRFASEFAPRWLVIENVVSMRRWSRYAEFIGQLHELGYQTREQVLNSRDFGVPQSRRRLFITCDREGQPPEILSKSRAKKTARSIIDWHGEYSYAPLRTKRRAANTLARAERGIQNLGDGEPFLVVYYGSDHAGGWQEMDVPLRTITTVDRFAIVRPTKDGHEMRMLQPRELQQAMGMPKRFDLGDGTRRNRVHLIGNAVCPPVMQRVVKTLTA